jgi:hypothetical protein
MPDELQGRKMKRAADADESMPVIATAMKNYFVASAGVG